MRLILLSTAVLLTSSTLQDKPSAADAVDPALQKRIDAAVEKGVKWLLDKYTRRGLPGQQMNELVCLALVHSGLRRDHPLLVEEIRKILGRPIAQTYQVGLLALLLEKLDRRQFQPVLAETAAFFVDSQCRNGQWSYTGHARKIRADYTPRPSERKDDNPEPGATRSDADEPLPGKTIRIPPAAKPNIMAKGDNSNSQYAVMGLFAAARANCELPKEMLEKTVTWWVKAQNEDGGWGYMEPAGPEPNESSLSMTTAGLTGLIVCRTYLGQDPMADPAVKKGLEWLGKNLDFAPNPKTISPDWHFYFLYGLERVGRIAGLKEIGGRDWYKEGATWLLANQKADGQWGARGEKYEDPISTSFALLFLCRSTPALPKFKDVATGDSRKRD